MAELEIHYVKGLRCDKCNAVRHWENGPVHSYGAALDNEREKARADGWKRYVGRSVRHYCPDCEPSPKAKLERRELTRR
jgi:hypothetical protein